MKAMNAIELLKQQHRIVLQTLKDMTEPGGTVDPDELRLLADEIVAHTLIEEHVFYPRVRQLMRPMIDEAFEEHTVARFELARALTAEGAEQKTRLRVLKDLLEHHIEEEETEMFPMVMKAIRHAELERLGDRMSLMFDRAVEKGFEGLVVSDGQPKRLRSVPQSAARGPARSARSLSR
jgi:hemerythrin superfamily protein